MATRRALVHPFFTFFGGKWRAAPHYPAPRHGTIVEPFAGSAGYAVRYCDRDVVLIEPDPLIAATWRYLLRVSPEELRALPDIANDQTVDDLPVCEEARLLIGWWCNKGASRPMKSPAAWMRSGIRPRSYWGPEIRERLASEVDRIRHWTLIEGGYEEAPEIEATWFIDPPYRYAGRNYRYGSSDIDYEHLAEWCRARRGQTIVCESLGADWLPFARFHTIKTSPAKHGGKKSQELVWLNTWEQGE